MRKGWLTLKSFFRAIDIAFLILAVAAAAFCWYSRRSLVSFPAEEYDARIAELKAETEKTRADTEAAKAECAARLEYIGKDLKNTGAEGEELAGHIEELEAGIEDKSARLEELNAMIEIYTDMRGSAEALRHEYGLKIRELEEKIMAGESDVKICYWTFDDGPTYITDQFLDALDAMGDHVYVTFFTSNMANDSPNEEEMLRRETMSGHSVQNHSFSHQWEGNVYTDLDSFKEQVQKQDEWVFEVTGFHPGIFRFPGSSNQAGKMKDDAIAALEEMGYEWVEWSCNTYDSGPEERLPAPAAEAASAVRQISTMPIANILSHDWNYRTLGAIKIAIPELMEQGYVFLPLFPESSTMGENTVVKFY